jgi:hypothetical protein
MAMRKSRIAYLSLCIVALQSCPTVVHCEGLTVGNITAALKASPLIPFQKFEEQDLIPGTAVFGVVTERLRGVDVLRVRDFETCQVESPRQWFRVRAPTVSYNSQGKAELEDLRSLLGAPAGAMNDIDNVDVQYKNVWSLYAPYLYVQENFAKALKGSSCAANRDRGKAAMIVRAVLADITLKFAGRSLTKDHAAAFFSKTDPAPDVSNDGAFFTITLSHRVIALNLGVPP